MIILTIVFPIIGFLILLFFKKFLSENLAAIVGISSVGLSALATGYVGIDFFNNNQKMFMVPLWTWVSVNNFNISFNLVFDGLSLTMLSIVIGVGFLIHIFASWYMRQEENYSLFFAYSNLFIASMVILVLADSLALMYLGWEIMGLCSYLLIGFYYTHPKNGEAAIKAFIVTRIGGVFLILSLLIIYSEFGTLSLQEMAELTPTHFEMEKNVLWWAMLMLLGGAVSKSAQLPLQTWLSDAMVGPTPASALIHAATMVTAGVYLIARTHFLFLMTPEILHLVSIIGATTLIMASFSAMVQTDIKRILAYSTMSQIGYMFLGIGIQAWDAAIFHLMAHSFFKALLFLASGSLILFCDQEQNIFKMGGLRKFIPMIYVYFLIGSAANAALPLMTASFFSKGNILSRAMASGYIDIAVIGLVGAFMTSLYTFRMIFVIFHGKEKILYYKERKEGVTYHLPLIILLILSTSISVMIVPPLEGVLPNIMELDKNYILMVEIISSIITIAGILISAWLWLDNRVFLNKIFNSTLGRFLYKWWYSEWGFNWLYHMIFVKPFLGIARILKSDPLNALMNAPVIFIRFASKSLLFIENGYLRWYLIFMIIGAVFVLSLLIALS